MAKIIEMPVRFEREVVSIEVEVAGTTVGGYIVEFQCGHTVWFAAPVRVGDLHHCSLCFDHWLAGQLKRLITAGGYNCRHLWVLTL